MCAAEYFVVEKDNPGLFFFILNRHLLRYTLCDVYFQAVCIIYNETFQTKLFLQLL